MADGEVNFSINTTAGPVSPTTYTRGEFIDTLQYLQFTDSSIRAIDNIETTASYGMFAFDSSGVAAARTITASDGLSVTNGSGVAGNPMIGVNSGATLLQKILDAPEGITTNAQTVSVTTPLTIFTTATPVTCTVPQAPVGEVSLKILMNNTGATIDCQETYGSMDGSGITLFDKQIAILVSDEAQKWTRIDSKVDEAGAASFVSVVASANVGAATLSASGLTSLTTLNISSLPTSAGTLPAGTVWNSSGTLKIA